MSKCYFRTLRKRWQLDYLSASSAISLAPLERESTDALAYGNGRASFRLKTGKSLFSTATNLRKLPRRLIKTIGQEPDHSPASSLVEVAGELQPNRLRDSEPAVIADGAGTAAA